MSIEIGWYLPYRVIDARLYEEVTPAEVRELASHFVEMLTQNQLQTPHKKLYLLCDTVDAISVPPLYLMLKDALPVMRFKNRGPLFHVTQNRSIRSIMQLTAHITHIPVFSFETRDEAVRVLAATLIKEDLEYVEN
jgi:hypothetical protein